VSVLPRPLWPDIGPPPDQPGSWEEFADDLDAGLREHGITNPILVGHSFGAVASLVAAARHPGRYRALILLDPTILPEEVFDRIRVSRAEGRGQHRSLEMARRARERRSDFSSRQEAFDLWRGRKIFQDWSDEALWCYVEAGLRPVAGGFTLAWSGAWEAHSYESIYVDSWTEVARLPPGLPVLVIRGGLSDVFIPESAERFIRLAAGAEVDAIPGYGHLFPQAAPVETARRIAAWLDRRIGGHS
jgi:pimeloyl-ACP methyl ester carboxylesterase